MLTGFSQGGYISFVLASEHPERFCGVIPMGAYADGTIALPDPQADTTPRYFLLIGGDDGNADGSRRTARRFQEAGVDTKIKVFPGFGHIISPQWETDMTNALRHVLATDDRGQIGEHTVD